jgi:hypothetical protein
MSIYDYSSDEVLIERFKEGDEFAFDLLVRRYEQKVYQLAYRLTATPTTLPMSPPKRSCGCITR